MLMGDPSSILVDVKAFIQPEEFYNKSLYLLFSKERTLERENENLLKKAFMIANLKPKRLVVEQGAMVLECAGYGQALAHDQYLFEKDPTFTRFFLPATYHINVGQLPSPTAGQRANGLSYTFRQDSIPTL
jgi:hypothetical protein